jgi:hypothetical protein
MSVACETRSSRPNTAVVPEQSMASLTRAISAGEAPSGVCVRGDAPARAALTDLARLLGRRAASRHRASAGFGEFALGPVLIIVGMAATAVLLAIALLKGH